MSVAGFDGVPESGGTRPPLTTVAQPIRDLGRRAVEALLAPAPAPAGEMLPVELVVRGSTAPPKPA